MLNENKKSPVAFMKKIQIIFFSIFLIYHLAVLIMVFFINKNAEDIGFLLALHDRIALMFYGATLGLVLYFISLGLYYLQKMRFDGIINSKEGEIIKLKAEIYDLERKHQEEDLLGDNKKEQTLPYSLRTENNPDKENTKD